MINGESGNADGSGPSPAAYRQLAEFRFNIRSFLHASADIVRAHAIEPQQHQLMLAIKGLPPGTRPTVTTLARCLWLKHHSTVELINRLEKRGAVVRTPSDHDRREVLIQLTPAGEELIDKLTVLHWRELQSWAPAWCAALNTILQNTPSGLQHTASELTGVEQRVTLEGNEELEALAAGA
jgi:DNA-binding MarR family transcriptional regulator